MKQNVSATDRKIVNGLLKDGRTPVREIGEPIGISSPTVRSRLQKLIESGICRVSALIDMSHAKGLNVAIIGITLDKHETLNEKIDEIADLDRVHWAASVTGKYDIIAEVIFEDSMDDLYSFLTFDLPKIGGIRSTESFLVLKAKRKWILLPKGIKSWNT